MDELLKNIIGDGECKRVVPFYTFNDGMTCSGIREQIAYMARSGVGGVYVHARSGLSAEYLGAEWFTLVDALVEACSANNMQVWIYDEFGWPSGIADGKTLNGGTCVKWLDYIDGKVTVGGSSGYVDVFNKDATCEFIRLTHEKYHKRYGSKIKGFFTDEPQYGLHHAPYSPVLAASYKEATGREILDDAAALFETNGSSEKVRNTYYTLAAELFLKNYVSVIADWCAQRGYELTGHFLEEKAVSLQVESAGDILKLYRAMQRPGMDWLGKSAGADDAAPKQISSVCRQFGKPGNVAETYACAGYGARTDELKNIADWEMSCGINHLCMIFPYSFRGRRKRDYPSGLMPGNPQFELAYEYFNYINRLGDLVQNAEERADVLVLLPLNGMKSAFGSRGAMNEIDGLYSATLNALRAAHINYHISNADILSENGEVRGDKIYIGKCGYDTVLQLDGCGCPLLKEFKGAVYNVTADSLRQTVSALGGKAFIRADNDLIAVNEYICKGTRVIIARNTADTEQTVNFVTVGGEKLSELLLERGERIPPQEGGSRVCFKPLETRTFALVNQNEQSVKREYVTTGGEGWHIVDEDKNVMLLDRCAATVNGKPYGLINVIQLNELLMQIKTCKLDMLFTVNCKQALNGIYLAVEDGGKFDISVNGISADKACGTYLNGTFNTYKISLVEGENEIRLKCSYSASSAAVSALNNAESNESDFNRVRDTFDIESIYLLGDFEVERSGVEVKDGCEFFGGGYILIRKGEIRDISAISQCGRPFFTGKITLRKTVNVNLTPNVRQMLDLNLKGAVAKVYINGEAAAVFFWNGRPHDVTEYLVDGENVITLEIYTNLRNLFGPFHNKYGNPNMVGFTTFTATRGWCDPYGDFWTDGYVTQVTGIEFKSC